MTNLENANQKWGKNKGSLEGVLQKTDCKPRDFIDTGACPPLSGYIWNTAARGGIDATDNSLKKQ